MCVQSENNVLKFLSGVVWTGAMMLAKIVERAVWAEGNGTTKTLPALRLFYPPF